MARMFTIPSLGRFVALLAGFFVVLIFAGVVWIATHQEVQPGSVYNVVLKPVEEVYGATSALMQAEPPQLLYVRVTQSWGPYFGGECGVIRSGPGTHYPIVMRMRTDAVLHADSEIADGIRTWYRIAQDDWLRYPERVRGEWYIASDFVEPIRTAGTQELSDFATTATSTKRIVVDRSNQTLFAYDGDTLYMQEIISTGLELTPTPRGTFTIYKKTPSRYMQGPIPGIGDQHYDLPGVPWNLYFTSGGAVIHGAYWHDKFGTQWSHGCVNLPPEKARTLYEWAEVGTQVTVRD